MNNHMGLYINGKITISNNITFCPYSSVDVFGTFNIDCSVNFNGSENNKSFINYWNGKGLITGTNFNILNNLENQTNCIYFISATNPTYLTFTYTDLKQYNLYSMIGGSLLLFCKEEQQTQESIKCYMNATRYVESYVSAVDYSFTSAHCPCSNNCVIIPTTNSVLGSGKTIAIPFFLESDTYFQSYNTLENITIQKGRTGQFSFKGGIVNLIESNDFNLKTTDRCEKIEIGVFSNKTTLLIDVSVETVVTIKTTNPFATEQYSDVKLFTVDNVSMSSTIYSECSAELPNGVKIKSSNQNLEYIEITGWVKRDVSPYKYSIKFLAFSTLFFEARTNGNDVVINIEPETKKVYVENKVTDTIYIVSKVGLLHNNIQNTSCGMIEWKNGIEKCIICSINGHWSNSQCVLNYLAGDECDITSLKGCSQCYNGYELTENYACILCPNNCKQCNNGVCMYCNDNYQLIDGYCVQISSSCSTYLNGYCGQCSNGYYLGLDNFCGQCPTSCSFCSLNGCLKCDDPKSFIFNGSCTTSEYVNVTTASSVISCLDGYFVNDSKCESCFLIENCELCEKEKCLKCYKGTILNNGSCLLISNCLEYDGLGCVKCYSNYYLSDRQCLLKTENNCLNYGNFGCIECTNGTYLTANGCVLDVEVAKINDSCLFPTELGCKRCFNGYYLTEFGRCKKCDASCEECIQYPIKCLKCFSGTFLDNYECITSADIGDRCLEYTATGGCYLCRDGYYRTGFTCKSCLETCATCNNEINCLTCNEDYFMDIYSECEPKSNIIGCTEGNISSALGCLTCQDGYFSYQRKCSLCPMNCSNCEGIMSCTACQNGHILVNGVCVYFEQVTFCQEAANSKCVRCSFWHEPIGDGSACKTHVVWWVVLILCIFISAFIISAIAFTFFTTKKILKLAHIKEREKTVCVFEMSRSNVAFKYAFGKKSVVVNKKNLTFSDDHESIPVSVETKDLLCVGNKGKNSLKIQLSLRAKTDKFKIRTNPNIVTIRKGEACEFEIFIKPLCSCKINEVIKIITKDLKTSEETYHDIFISTETEISTKLDYEEIKEEKLIGEGAFGIVYVGTFRGNKVAIKKMKTIRSTKFEIQEFKKEVGMLDKFRCEYIVHFYGAVFIPTKVCMVTEFAQFGSLDIFILNQRSVDVSTKLRIKILLDAAKGVEYLHTNGILHRDIKPENILVFEINPDSFINAKLTDFGSARNINMLMTNMTFTKGIGTPTYMAPEVLNRYNYKKSADIYSFAITMLQTMIWRDVYPEDEFKFPWLIAEFVTSGKRLEIPDDCILKEVIKKSWEHDPSLRISVSDLVLSLTHICTNM